jgi:uncharacterized protein (DUF488 family)
MRLFTCGHGTLDAERFATLLGDAGVELVADVRAFPGSRRHPHFGRDAMTEWLPGADLAYRWIPALGGRRRPVAGSAHVALRNDSFRAYADHMETPLFAGGVTEVLNVAGGAPTAVLCSESLWWRCHRRLLADHLVLVDDVDVVHLLHDGRQSAHGPTEGVRLDGQRLVYDAGVTPPLFS